MNKKLIFFSLLAILAVACFFRLWQLELIPPGLYPDVAVNGTNALDTLQSGNLKLFYPDNNGREGLIMWLVAISFWLFGPSVWAMKIVTATVGILTVLGLYALVKETIKPLSSKFLTAHSEQIALLSSFFLAISFWHVNFSRIGFRAIMVPFFLVFGFYFLTKGFNNKRAIPFILSGIFIGAGFYTYISYRFVVFMLAIFLFCQWLLYRKEKIQKKFWLFSTYFVIFVLITALPIGIYFLQNLGDFFGRAGGVSIFAAQNPIYELGKSLVLHLGMFNIHGDGNWRHNLSGSPELLWPVGIFFIIGVVLSLKDLIFSVKNKKIKDATPHILLWTWFFFMMASGFLSSEGAPHALRTIGAIPPVFILSGIGCVWLFSLIKPFFKTDRQRIGLYFCALIFLSSLAFAEFKKYFIVWAQEPAVSFEFSKNFVDIGNYLNSLPDNVSKYVIVNQNGVAVPYPNGLPVAAQTPMFIERSVWGRTRSMYIRAEEIENITIESNSIIVPLQKDDALFEKLSQRFPYNEIIKTDNFWAFKIK